METIFIIIYLAFSTGIGLAYGIKENDIVGRFIAFIVGFILAPMAIGYEIMRKLLNESN